MGWDGIDSRLGGFEFLIMSRGGLLHENMSLQQILKAPAGAIMQDNITIKRNQVSDVAFP